MYTAYQALYESMKTRFTVVDGKNEYSLGEYMRNKAARHDKRRALSRTLALHAQSSVSGAVSAIQKKCTVNEAPAPENTLTAFPLRTSVTALCAALCLCLCVFPVVKLKDAFALSNAESEITVIPTVLEEEDLYSTVNL